MESLVYRHVLYLFPTDHLAPRHATGEILHHQGLQEIYPAICDVGTNRLISLLLALVVVAVDGSPKQALFIDMCSILLLRTMSVQVRTVMVKTGQRDI
jgi:hypothetical protein